MATPTNAYLDYLKKKNQETIHGQAVPYQYGDDMVPQGFWAEAQEKLKQGWRVVPSLVSGPDKDKPRAGWLDHRLPTNDDWWVSGRPGAYGLGSGGQSYKEMDRELLLAQYPGAKDILGSGVPWYGGDTDAEERMLRIRAQLKFGTRYIDDLTLDTDQQMEFDASGNLATRMSYAKKAYEGHAQSLVDSQDEKFSHKIYEGIFESVGKYWHGAAQKATDLMEAGLATGYYHYSGDENYKKEWAKYDQAMIDGPLTKMVYNPLTQLQGSAMHADMAENIFYQWLPWNWNKPDAVHSLGNVQTTITWLKEHPGVSEAVAKGTLTNEYWSSFADDWLNPFYIGIDVITEIVFPPAMIWTMGKVTTKFLPRVARRAAQVTPELAKVLNKADGNLTSTGRLAGIGDEMFEAVRGDGLVDALMKDMDDTIEGLKKWQLENGLFTQTAGTKAAMTAEDTQDGIRWIAGATKGQGTAEFMHVLELVGDLGSGSKKTVDDAMRQLSKIPNFDYWFSQSGQTAAYVMNKMMDMPAEDLIKFVNRIDALPENSRKVAELLVWGDNLARKLGDEMFPTLEEALKAGRKLSPGLRAAEKAHRNAQKLYAPVTQFFSNWYLGRTPGYAVRNAAQNFSQTIWDLGIGSSNGWKHIDDAFNWAGMDEAIKTGTLAGKSLGDLAFVGMERELSGIAGVLGQAMDEKKGVSRFFDMRWWSNKAEIFGGRSIFGHEYPKEMRKILKGNLKRQYMEMGLDKKTATFMENAIIDHKGDLALARKHIEKTVGDGFFRNASLSNFPPDMQKKAEAFNMTGKLFDWVNDSDNYDDFALKLDQWIDDIIESAEKKVKKEGATSPSAGIGREIGDSANAVAFEGQSQTIHDIAATTKTANKRVNDAVGDAIETTREEAVAGLVQLGKQESEARAIFASWTAEVDLVVDGEKAAAVGKMNGDQFFNQKKFSGYEGKLSKQIAEVKNVWRSKVDDLEAIFDTQADIPGRLKSFWNEHLTVYGDYAGQDVHEIRRALFRQWTDQDAMWWNDWTEQNYNMARQVADHIQPKVADAGVSVRPAEHLFSNASDMLGKAHDYQKWLPEGQLQYAISKAQRIRDEPKRLHTFAVEYARKYGIDTLFEKDGRTFLNHSKLVAIINKQLNTNFDKLNNMKGISRLDIQDAMRHKSLGLYRGIVDDPDSAIEILLKVTDAGEFGNISVMDRLTSGEVKKLKRFRNLLATADQTIANDLSNAINARRTLPDVATALDHDAYNDLAKLRDKADDDIAKAVDAALELLGDKKVTGQARKFSWFVNGVDQQDPHQVVNAIDQMDKVEFEGMMEWLKTVDEDLWKSFGMQYNAPRGRILDIVEFPSDLTPSTKAIDLVEDLPEEAVKILDRATETLSAEQIGAIDQQIAEALIRAQKKLDKHEAKVAAEASKVSKLINDKTDESTEYVAKAFESTQVEADDFMHLWGGEDAPTMSRMVVESQDDLRAFAEQIKTGYRAQWDDVVRLSAEDKVKYLDDWNDVEDVSKGMMSEARMGAMKTVREKRDFILHNYGDRRNFDTLLAYIYPYHFWHTRNAVKWGKRVAARPMIAVGYQHYKDRMARINADMPDWYKQSTRFTGFMGFDEENPLMVNLEALISPAYQAIKVPFHDPDKRDTQFARFLDDAGRVSSTHTMYGILYGLGRYLQGDKIQGAAWMSRMIPQTKVTTALTSKVAQWTGHKEWERGIELDPIVGLQGAIENSNPAAYFTALDPYEQKRIAVGYQTLVKQGKYTDEDVVDAIMSDDPNHPITVEAHGIAQSKKNFGDLASFIGGPGFQIRNEDERAILKMDEEMRSLFQYSDQLKPEEKAQFYQIMREKYPTYFNSVMLTRKDRDQREEAFVYNVMARIPPGQTSQIYEAVGLDYATVQKFYDSKGESLLTMPEADRLKFMAGIHELSTVASFPDAATSNEWREAKNRSANMRKELTAFYGEHVFAYRDKFFELLRDPKGPEAAYQYLDAHPQVGDLMSDEAQWKMSDPLLNKYYASFDQAKSMLNSEMYDRLEAMYPNILNEQEAYFDAQTAGERVKASDRLKAYWDDKRAMSQIYDEQLAGYGKHLPQAGDVDFPRRFDPEDMEVDMETLSQGEQRLSTMELDKAGTPAQYHWTWEQWEQIMPPVLARLAQDWAFRGAELGEDAQKNLEYILEPWGMDASEAMALMRNASEQAGAEYYGPDNPPWWEGE